MKLSNYKGSFLLFFVSVVAILTIVKCTHPEWTLARLGLSVGQKESTAPLDSVQRHALYVDSLLSAPRKPVRLHNPDGTPVKHPVYSVVSLEDCFPDLNDVQLATATRLGVSQIANRADAEHHKKQLVDISKNPHFVMRNLTRSIPFLVPRAARLLERIAQDFSDSLAVKGYPPYKLLVTSVLRTKEDVAKLRQGNRNASENSCHQYATTFDITYNNFHDVRTGQLTASVKLKSILAEVLEDHRLMGTCYVKYEFHQPCFHITAR